ncbi:50S ribosomal protein L21 [Achromatium sp. WMS2]|nr:50S ribosomal protein L21 [Achromatium sp. WMS2]
MYAIIQTGGKQYRVAPGQFLKVEKIVANSDIIELNQVLMIADGEKIQIGSPYVDGGRVQATIMHDGRDQKVKIIKFRRRKHHMKHQGHRQYYTLLRVDSIVNINDAANPGQDGTSDT